MVKKFIRAAGGSLMLLCSGGAMARDTTLRLPLADVLAMPEAQEKIDGSVKFFLAGAEHPSVKKQMGSAVSNRKTNGFGKGDEAACRWAALSALLAFQGSAKQQGANAVINLVSYYKKQPFQSSTEYECHAGGLIVGVAFKGDYAITDQQAR
ncbi:MAG: excinuclease ATPase subunit [Pseudomonadota bacterium]